MKDKLLALGSWGVGKAYAAGVWGINKAIGAGAALMQAADRMVAPNTRLPTRQEMEKAVIGINVAEIMQQDVPLSKRVGVPGSHNSYAVLGDIPAHNQQLSLKDQLNSGARVVEFDIAEIPGSNGQVQFFHALKGVFGLVSELDIRKALETIANHARKHPDNVITIKFENELLSDAARESLSTMIPDVFGSNLAIADRSGTIPYTTTRQLVEAGRNVLVASKCHILSNGIVAYPYDAHIPGTSCWQYSIGSWNNGHPKHISRGSLFSNIIGTPKVVEASYNYDMHGLNGTPPIAVLVDNFGTHLNIPSFFARGDNMNGAVWLDAGGWLHTDPNLEHLRPASCVFYDVNGSPYGSGQSTASSTNWLGINKLCPSSSVQRNYIPSNSITTRHDSNGTLIGKEVFSVGKDGDWLNLHIKNDGSDEIIVSRQRPNGTLETLGSFSKDRETKDIPDLSKTRNTTYETGIMACQAFGVGFVMGAACKLADRTLSENKAKYVKQGIQLVALAQNTTSALASLVVSKTVEAGCHVTAKIAEKAAGPIGSLAGTVASMACIGSTDAEGQHIAESTQKAVEWGVRKMGDIAKASASYAGPAAGMAFGMASKGWWSVLDTAATMAASVAGQFIGGKVVDAGANHAQRVLAGRAAKKDAEHIV